MPDPGHPILALVPSTAQADRCSVSVPFSEGDVDAISLTEQESQKVWNTVHLFTKRLEKHAESGPLCTGESPLS